jgi:electron transfer flavoprotein alpha/beta subunit
MVMDVLVCCKIVPDLDMLAEDDWIIPAHGRIDTAFVRNMINPYDECALELALGLADRSVDGPTVRLAVLSVGGKGADPALKTLRALGFAPVRIEPRSDWRFCPEGIAAMIAARVRDGHQELLILGRQSGEGDHAKTPLLAAELLGWPCITEVVRMEPAGQDRLEVTSLVDGMLRQTVTPPLVLSVGNVAGCALRVPTLKDRMRAGQGPVDVIDEQALPLTAVLARHGEDYALEGLAPINRRRAGRLLEGSSAEIAQALYQDCLKPWLDTP